MKAKEISPTLWPFFGVNNRDDDIPLVKNRYAMKKVLDGGAMGTVFEARDSKMNRDVAVKIINPSAKLTPSEQVDRIVREGKIMARLRHDRIVQVYALQSHEGQPFLVMELLSGR